MIMICSNSKTIRVKSLPLSIVSSYQFERSSLTGKLVPRSDFPSIPLYRDIVVGCGACSECLRKKQYGFVQRVYKAMQNYSYAYFTTLTYRDSKLPVAVSLERKVVDTSTGELSYQRVPEKLALLHEVVYIGADGKRFLKPPKDDFHIVDSSELLSFVRGKLLAQRASSNPRYYTRDVDGLFGDGSKFRWVYTFSVSRADFQSWLKSARIQYKREFDKPLPDFKYLVCGEMGPKTCRPHMHCLFLSKSQDFGAALDWILTKWQERFGFTQRKTVDYVNKDGSNGALAVAKYISKYISKGKFECDSVKCKYAEKGRLCASKNLGAEDFPGPLRSWYLGFDIYGRYDLNTLHFLDKPGSLNLSQAIHLCDVINRRCMFTFPDGKSFPMSTYFKDKLFKYVYFTESGERKVLRYYISFLANLRLQDVQDSSFNERLQRALQGVAEDRQEDALQAFIKGEQLCVQNRELDTEKALESFYSQSIF